MYCKICDVGTIAEIIYIGKETIGLCKCCYESIVDKYYEKMCEQLENEGN